MAGTGPISATVWTSALLDIAGFGVEIRADDPALSAVVIEDTRTLRHHPGPVSLRVTWGEAPIDFSGVEFDGADGHRRFGHSDRGLFVRHRELTAFTSEQGIEIGGTGADTDELLDDFQTVFGSALAYWLSLRQYFPLHGAAVGRDDEALLLVGSPGSGKSTAAWGAYQAGVELLADDTLFVRLGAGGYEVCGMRKPIAIPREVLGDPPAGASQDPVDRGGRRDRWDLQPDLLTSGWRRLAGVLTPAHGADSDGALIARMRAPPMVISSPSTISRWSKRRSELTGATI